HVLASSKSLVTRWIVTTFVAASLLTLPWLLPLPPGLGVMASAACATAAIKACSAALVLVMGLVRRGWSSGAWQSVDRVVLCLGPWPVVHQLVAAGSPWSGWDGPLGEASSTTVH
ncbi:hypothetical protein HaLaN_22522, partial [Haematococcus lacustris]